MRLAAPDPLDSSGAACRSWKRELVPSVALALRLAVPEVVAGIGLSDPRGDRDVGLPLPVLPAREGKS